MIYSAVLVHLYSSTLKERPCKIDTVGTTGINNSELQLLLSTVLVLSLYFLNCISGNLDYFLIGTKRQ